MTERNHQFLLVGLGNPGVKYADTRHNAGFLVLDKLVADYGGHWDSQGKVQGILGKVTIEGSSFICLKPQTFMNRSGISVRATVDYYKIPEDRIIVLFDDMDVPAQKVKCRKGGGHGGHNGIRSLIDHGGLKEFYRIKLGLGRPPQEWDPADWLLSKLSQEETQALLGPMVPEVLLRLQQILDQNSKKV
jgi:PTH1 family peptidyl-tRNA hydrolase